MKILIAEDDNVSRVLLTKWLVKWDYEVVAARDGAEAWAMLETNGAPRLALLDWMMPYMDGLEVCRRIRARKDFAYTYIVLLTARDAKLDVIEGLNAGADDYLTKPFHPEELSARLRAGSRILKLEDNLVAAREVLRFKATHDPLTGLWNRGAILDTLQRELARSRRESSSVGVLLTDLDHFKQINDSRGHLAGDEVLREVARRLTSSVRVYDAVGRFGGEEFLIVLPGCDAEGLRERGAQLVDLIGKSSIPTSEGDVPLTISIGATCTGRSLSVKVDEMLHTADMALYRAKAAGRNRLEVADWKELGPTGGNEPTLLDRRAG